MFDRRVFLASGASLVLVASCGPSGPGAVTIVAQGSAGVNTGPDGGDRPLSLQIVQLRAAGAFDAADIGALQDPAKALAADFIKADVIVLNGAAKVTKDIALDPSVALIGVIAGFRDPSGKVVRAKSTVSASAKATFQLNVTAGGISLVAA